MRSGYPYTCLCVGFLISFLLINFPQAQASNDSLFVVTMERTADSLHGIGQYNDASLAYEKAIYFNSEPVSKARLSLKRAQSLKQIGSFEIAEQTLNRVDLNSLPDSLLYEVKYNAALCAYLGTNFTIAESHLIQLIYFGKDSSKVFTCYPLYSLILNELGKYSEAEKYLGKYIQCSYNDTSRTRISNEIKNLYSKKNQPKLKRLKKAKVMSYIVPGLGQMYAGYWGEGLTAAACNAVFIGLTGVGIFYQYYVTSILYSYSIFAKFYVGNVKRVEFLVNKKNYQLTKNYNEKLKQKIIGYWK
jgi:tetratricopeptide (TPR) repeat protein